MCFVKNLARNYYNHVVFFAICRRTYALNEYIFLGKNYFDEDHLWYNFEKSLYIKNTFIIFFMLSYLYLPKSDIFLEMTLFWIYSYPKSLMQKLWQKPWFWSWQYSTKSLIEDSLGFCMHYSAEIWEGEGKEGAGGETRGRRG